MMNTIVVPLVGPDANGADVSTVALPVAASLATRLNAGVVLVSVLDLFLDMGADGEPRLVYATDALPPSEFAEEMREKTERLVVERQAYLDQVAATFPQGRARGVLRYGDAAQEILNLAVELENVVVVIGSHSRTGLQRLMLGSVAFSVVSQSSRPVVVVPMGEDLSHDREYHITTVVVPLDGSSMAERILDDGLRPLAPGGLTVHLVHVVNDDEADYGRARQYLEEVATRLRDSGFDVGWTMREGNPIDVVTAVASDVNADLIAATTHGRGGMREMLLGSIAEQLVHAARRPMMLIRPGEQHFPDSSRRALW